MNEIKKYFEWVLNNEFDKFEQLLTAKDDYVEGNHFQTKEEAEEWLKNIDTYNMNFGEGDYFVLIENYSISVPEDNSIIIKNRAKSCIERLNEA